MNIEQAHGLLNEIEALLYSGVGWDIFWRNVLNEIRAGDVDGLFHEALVFCGTGMLIRDTLSTPKIIGGGE